MPYDIRRTRAVEPDEIRFVSTRGHERCVVCLGFFVLDEPRVPMPAIGVIPAGNAHDQLRLARAAGVRSRARARRQWVREANRASAPASEDRMIHDPIAFTLAAVAMLFLAAAQDRMRGARGE